MAVVPRPLLIALAACVLAGAAFYATRGGASSPPPVASSPTHEVTPKPLSPNGTAKSVPTPSSKTPSKSATKPAQPKSPNPPAKPKPKPAPVSVQGRVERALGHKVVVVFFRQRVGADDTATAAAVKSVRGTKGVAVFSDSIKHLSRYPRLIAGLGINQAPSVVVVGKDRKAQLLEGYLDSGTLHQQVVDAR